MLRLGGDFTQGEISARAAQLTASWEAHWPGAAPIGYKLRDTYDDRWVRFHSLPNSERNATTLEEHTEVLHRYKTVLLELIAQSPADRIHVIARDWHANDGAGGWTKKHMPGAWAWRTHHDPEEFEPGEAIRFSYLWVADIDSIADLDPLLTLSADGQAHIIVIDTAMTWIFSPYEGGADVILQSEETREALAAKFESWLSPHPLGY